MKGAWLATATRAPRPGDHHAHTARQSERDVIQGLETGLDDYAIKPFSPDELAARVQTVLWRSGKRRSAE